MTCQLLRGYCETHAIRDLNCFENTKKLIVELKLHSEGLHSRCFSTQANSQSVCSKVTKVTAELSLRTSSSCWFPDTYCRPSPSNLLATGNATTASKCQVLNCLLCSLVMLCVNCQGECNNTEGCVFFTFLPQASWRASVQSALLMHKVLGRDKFYQRNKRWFKAKWDEREKWLL